MPYADNDPRRQRFDNYWHVPEDTDRTLGLWATTAGRYTSSLHTCPLRVREDFLLLFCASGKGVLQVEDTVHIIEGGMLFGLLPGVLHSYWSDPDEGWDIWYVHFNGELAGKLMTLTTIDERQPVILVSDPEPLQSKFAALCECLKKKAPRYETDTTAALFSLLLETRRLGKSPASTESWLKKAVTSGAEDLDTMAAAAGMSKFHFCRAFKEATGRSPWRYVIERRLARAKELLAGTSLSVKQIARETGFNDANYFSRLFSHEIGMSARAFRTVNQEQHS